MKTLKIIGFLLTYPSSRGIAALSECREILMQEGWLSHQTLQKIDVLIEWMTRQDLLDLQEEYVALFDRTPSLSLHLFEHVHGDSRDRGQALVDLSNVYEDAGLMISKDEMPDYLPLFLEYLSSLPVAQAREDLDGAIDVVAALGERLKNRESLYASVFDALVEAADRRPNPTAVRRALEKNAGGQVALAEMDAEWQEQFAFDSNPKTSGQGDGCPKAEEMLARMNISSEVPQ